MRVSIFHNCLVFVIVLQSEAAVHRQGSAIYLLRCVHSSHSLSLRLHLENWKSASLGGPKWPIWTEEARITTTQDWCLRFGRTDLPPHSPPAPQEGPRIYWEQGLRRVLQEEELLWGPTTSLIGDYELSVFSPSVLSTHSFKACSPPWPWCKQGCLSISAVHTALGDVAPRLPFTAEVNREYGLIDSIMAGLTMCCQSLTQENLSKKLKRKSQAVLMVQSSTWQHMMILPISQFTKSHCFPLLTKTSPT